MDPVRVGVTRKLIAWALTQSSTQCAVAQALKDASDDFVFPHVNQNTIRVTNARTRQRFTFKTPKKLAEWIDEFDNDPTLCKPVSFTLDFDAPDSVRPIKHNNVETAIKKSREHSNRNRKPARTVVPGKPSYRELRNPKV